MIAWTHRDGATLRRFVEGNGEALVLLPPHGRGPCDFDPLVTLLLPHGFRVIRPEPRGFGPSRGPLDCTLADLADDIATAIEAEGGSPVVVAGAAFGNRVARMLAVRRPELVRGLVLMAAGGRFPPGRDALAALRRAQDRSLTLDQRVEAARAVLFSPGSALSAGQMRLDAISSDALRAQSREVPSELWWSGGTAPMLVIQGALDVLAPPENGRSLLRDYPDRVTLHEIADGGHRIAEERPELMVPLIRSWLATLRRPLSG
jgi:pimeloyl-ACP methyl ester carboxylesterase